MRNLFAVMAVFISFGAFAENVQYSRDSRYMYIKTPVALTFDAEQVKAITDGAKIISEQLVAIRDANPRRGIIGMLDKKFAEVAAEFDKNLDSIVAYSQKYYGTVEPVGHHFYNAVPSGLLLFTGFELTGGLGLS